jgi:hypothetical protein
VSAPREILDLVARFEQQLDAYKSGQYNETQLRREFLDPFFKALGWDIDNEQGYAEAYKDVVHEDAIRMGSATKAPDYCFRIGGARKFFLEAKKPSVDIKQDISPAHQLRSYFQSGVALRLPPQSKMFTANVILKTRPNFITFEKFESRHLDSYQAGHRRVGQPLSLRLM